MNGAIIETPVETPTGTKAGLKAIMRKVILPLTVFSALAAAAVVAEAAPSTLPVLAKRTSSVNASGQIRSFECLIHPDGIILTRNFGGIFTNEEKAFSITGSVAAKIDEVANTAPTLKKTSPLDFSYSIVAFRASASGIQDTVVLSSFDGVTGEDVFNSAPAAFLLRDLINTACGN